MNNFIETIPEILEQSETLFGFFALIVLVIAFLSYVFYIRAEKADKNRAFILILLFFFGLVIVALLAGTLSGFQKGSEATTVQVSQNPGSVDPSLVRLTPTSISKLENYIESQGEVVTEENKARVLEEALDNHTNPSASSRLPLSTLPPPSTTPTGRTEFRRTVSDFLFVLEGCYRNEQNVSCRLKVTNQGEDRRVMYLYANSSRESIIFDGATRYIANEVRLADQRSNGRVSLEMPSDIGVDAQLSFSGVPETMNTLQAVEFWIFADGQNSPFKFEDVPVSSA